MRIFLTVLALLLLPVLALAQPAPNWIMAADPHGAYFADFPGKPQLQTSNEGERNGKPLINHVQGIEKDGAYFAVSSTDFGEAPSSDAERDNMLGRVLNGVLGSNPSNRLLSGTPVTVGGIRGFDFIFESPPQKIRARARIFIVGSKLVQQLVTGSPGIETSAETTRFMESLRLAR